MDLGLRAAHNSPAVVSDPTEPRFVAVANRLDAPDFGCALQISGDGGRGWRPAQPVAALPEGADKCYAPEIAFDRHGVLYYLFVGLAGRGNEPMGVFLTTSADRARTFSHPRRVLGPLNFSVRMAIDRSHGEHGRLHLVWLHATSDPPLGGLGPPPNPIMSAYSDDGGRTFSRHLRASDPSRQRVVAPALAVGGGGTVHVAYYDLGDDVIDYQGLEGPTWEGRWSLVVATSRDGGESFSPGNAADEAVAPHERVMLVFTMAPPALAAAGSTVCVAWPDAGRGDPDVAARCSFDAGASWGGRRRVNDDALGNGHVQYLPRLSLAASGRLDAVFFEERRDGNRRRAHVVYTYASEPDGPFARSVVLSDDPSDTQIGQQYVHPSAAGLVEFGSRLGLLSEPERALAVWPDTRNSRTGTTAQDLFSAVVQFPPDGGIGPAGGGAALLLASLVVLAAAGAPGRTSPDLAGAPARP